MAGAEVAFSEDEPDTGKIDQRIVLYAKLAQLFDHFSPSDATAFVEHAQAVLDMCPTDRAMIFRLSERLVK